MQDDGLLHIIPVFWGALSLKSACSTLSLETTQISGSTERLSPWALRQGALQIDLLLRPAGSFQTHMA
jgi:hypothetical protein